MKELGIADEMIVGPEYEFYVFDRVEYSTRPEASGFRVDTRQAQWSTGNNGYQVPRKAGYHTTLPQDVTQDLRSRICMLLEDWGIRVKYHHPEVGGCGQMEIEVELGEMTHMADSTMAAKYIVKNAAAREGRTATFLPKPVAGEAGSGMHVHMHLFKDGQPIFYDEKGYAQLSDPAMCSSGNAGACGLLWCLYQSLYQFLQTPGSWVRGTGDHRLCHGQPQCGGTHPCLCQGTEEQAL